MLLYLPRESKKICLFFSQSSLADDQFKLRGTAHYAIKVFNVDGRKLSSFEPHSSFLHHNRTTPISSTCFHPHRMMLACSALNDTHVNVFTCDTKSHMPENTPPGVIDQV